MVVLCVACQIDALREDEVGDAEACEVAHVWSRELAGLEDDLVERVDRLRAQGGTCGEVPTNAVPALELQPTLRCAARMHAADQVSSGDLSHEGSDGSTTLNRLFLAEYRGIPLTELLAADFDEDAAVLRAWVGSPAHCEALFDASATDVGVGLAEDLGTRGKVWVLLTGRERE